MRALKPKRGIVAILDALGAANYSNDEIQQFMRSREVVLEALEQKAENVIDSKQLESEITTFTFNDTILILLESGTPPKPKDILAFLYVLRKFIVDSLANRILFRGAMSIGTFTVDRDKYTVMGEAISDAAAWYDKADWIGIIATPRTSIRIEHILERKGSSWRNTIIGYDVPLKDEDDIQLKVVNWPKVFYVKSLSPCSKDEQPREKLLGLLAQHRIPTGTEQKYFNTIDFFDYIVRKQKLKDK